MHIENVLSVFDGHSGLMISLEAAGYTVGKYYSSEIDKYAIKASNACYPDLIRLGDVRNVKASDLPKIDLFGGGSPCQSFSFAGKRNGMSTKCEIEILSLSHYLELKSENFEFEGYSYLFWEYMRILKELQQVNPNIYFFLENVEMGSKWEKVISKAIGVNGIHVNSALVSAQNRKRIYWTNIGMQPGGLFGDMYSIIPQPVERGILLKHVLESEVGEKYFIKNPKFGFDGLNLNAKGKALRNATGYSQTEKHNYDLIKIDVKGNIKNNQDKASCFIAGGNSGGNHSDMDLLVVGCDFRYDEGVRYKNDGKTGALLGRARNDESCGQLASINSRIRRLTPRECGRLQTIPEHIIDTILKSGVSESQIYKMFGNGWTIEAIVHFLRYMKFR